MKPILEIQRISKKYQISHQRGGGYLSLRERIVNTMKFNRSSSEDFWALNNISLEIQPGECLGIVGRNGAGKSTLLKVLSKITPPTAGRIISRGRIASLLEVGTGFHPELTGRENIYFNGSLLGMRRKEIADKFDEIVDFSGVEKFLDTPLKNYSSGMQLRLAFAVAAFLEPEILIIDEVLAVGDSEFQKKCLGKMEDVSKSGRTILFVSHNLNAVSTLCNSAIYLDQGSIKFKGDVTSTISHYLAVRDSVAKSNHVYAHDLNGLVKIKELELGKNNIDVFSDPEFSMVLSSNTANPISGLALLFFNSHQERVAIIDLRCEDLFSVSKEKTEILIKGSIYSLPFLEGEYSIGLYIDSHLCSGNFLDIINFTVNRYSLQSALISYPVQVRGFFELKNIFHVIEN